MMKKILTILAVLVALALPYGVAQAGSMLDGGAFGMVSFAGNVTINPSFGYYPAVKAEFGVGKFVFEGSVGGVFAGEVPEQVVGVGGAFQLLQFGMPFDAKKDGMLYLYLMGGVSSAQGTYSLIVDGSQYKIGPKLWFDFDALSPTSNKVSLYLAVPFMTAKVPEGATFDLQSVTYLAVEGGVSIGI